MKILAELKRVTNILLEYPGQWALCGGIAASIYRAKPRFTDDIDIALIDSPKISAKEIAEKVIKKLGLKSYLGFVPDKEHPSSQVMALLCARGAEEKRFIGFDFLLPVQFWIEPAVRVAQVNMIDFGFSKLPTITPEILILAKLYAVQSNPDRLQDIDDIREIAQSIELDRAFIRKEARAHSIVIPAGILNKRAKKL